MTAGGPDGLAWVWPPRLAGQPLLAELLGMRVTANPVRAAGAAAICGWGRKPTSLVGRAVAASLKRPYFALEDGFIRSVQPGTRSALSLVVDPIGIYYDSTQASALENMLAQRSVPADVVESAPALLRRVVQHRISKYNHGALHRPAGLSPVKNKPRVLVVDQTYGDLSVRYGAADAGTFERMLHAALAENPGAEIWVKLHPEVTMGRKQGYFNRAALPKGVRTITDAINPFVLFEYFDRVYTVSSQMGFEALLAGLPVSVFGLPFYAGWGVSDDRMKCERRDVPHSVTSLFAAAYLEYPRYLNPGTGELGRIDDVLDSLLAQREVTTKYAGVGAITASGFSRWKRPYLAPYLGAGGDRITWADASNGNSNATFAMWGTSDNPPPNALHVEDGFIRSIGLGSDLIAPWSIVLDRRGIYFDARQPSDLSDLLNKTDFSDELRRRAGALREQIVTRGITKYNGPHRPITLRPPAGRRVILVPGQVEDDASIRYGTTDLRTAETLLREVRRRSPDAWIVYRPHPDVLAGNRKGLVQAHQLCDALDRDSPLSALLKCVDEVHTLSSLVGFDALIREKRVVTYGRPFYAGWGLTEDRASQTFRERTLTLDELVAAALILYPLYWDWDLDLFTTPEAVVERFAQKIGVMDGAPGSLRASPFRQLRRLRRWLANAGRS